jgi:integrase
MKQAERLGPKSLQYIISALRSFFRFLQLHGEIRSDLARGLVSPSRFRSDLRPKYLPWPKIQKFLAAIDRSHRAGKRDYAMLMLLACHGLRGREAATLRISDIDWERHSIFLRHRKNGVPIHLPLSPQTEEALRDYLAVRPACPAPEIFLTEVAPIKPFEGSVQGVATRHIRKFFGKLPFSQGSHLLRHSFAKALLDRGAKLHEVGALLGQLSLRSTQIYTRIATEDLREVADNYANLLPDLSAHLSGLLATTALP